MATTEAMHAAGAAAAEAKGGMPQLDFSTYPNQIFWLIVALVVLYLILSRIALPRIGSVLTERKSTITNDIAAAEDLKQRAIEAEKAYEKALADARVEAGRIVAQARAEIQGDLDAASAKADAEIAEKSAESEARIAEIRAGMQDSVSEVARDVAKQLVTTLGGKARPRLVNAAVAERLKG